MHVCVCRMRHLRAKEAAGVRAWEAATYCMRVWGVRWSASCAARRLEGRPAMLRGAALVASKWSRANKRGGGGSGMSGAAQVGAKRHLSRYRPPRGESANL